MLTNKADTLLNLQKKNIKFLIPKTKVYSVIDWTKNRNQIYKEIRQVFNKKIIIRSASYDEDTKFSSNAGKYLSIANIFPKKKRDVINAITKVINSYKKKTLHKSKILIQEQIVNASMSGVIFTHELETEAPYYVINYDDKTKKTNTVTSGTDKESNKKLIIHREGLHSLRSKRFKKLLTATIDLEKKINNKFLDIEYAVDQKLNIYLLQVRTMVKSKKKNYSKNTLEISSTVTKTRLKLKNIYKNKKEKTVLGQMPDWNPAEIIGKNPDYLAISLYKKIITDKNWLIARSQMGYKDFKKTALMQILAGKPYIDTSLSFKSFLPIGLNKNTSKKIVENWLIILSKNPHLHDKIEFDVAITCFSFDIKNKINKLLPKNINKKEIKDFIDLHKKNFSSFFNSSCETNSTNIRKKIDLLKFNQKNFKTHKILKKNILEVKKTIRECTQLGVIPFAQSARHAFIAQSLLQSMISKKILTNSKVKKFEGSFNTITSYFLKDINKVVEKKMTKKLFFNKYGHLRPGTYSLLSKNYKEMRKLEFKKQKLNHLSEKNIFSFKDIRKINHALTINGLSNIDAKDLLNYISFFISFREYSKFIFTKNINFILQLLELIGKKKDIKKKDLIFLKYSEIIENTKNYKQLIRKRKKQFDVNLRVKLPEVILDTSAIDVIPYMFNVPNFITDLRVRSSVCYLNSKISRKLKNSIVLIVNADPGYDWIFTKGIKGLITQFGGANSHMAIRCSELGIPAAIGCGEKKFDDIKNARSIELDCSLNTIKIVN